MLEIAQKLDWSEIEGATSRLLSRLVGFDTSNPPGLTSEAVDFIYKSLVAEDIFATLVPGDGSKKNLVAQVEGSGKQEPLLLACPLDVVGADPSGWSEFKPFSGYDDGRHIWGRGTFAAKSLAAAQVIALILIKQLGIPLRRHLRFVAYADGFSSRGSGLDFVTEEHLPLVDAEFCLGWGFPPSVELCGKTLFFIHRSEKPLLHLALRTEGRDGIWSGSDAAGIILNGIQELKLEFRPDYGADANTEALLKSLQAATGDDTVSAAIDAVANGTSEPGVELIPQSLIDYLSAQFTTNISVAHVNAGSPGSAGARTAEADVLIRPAPGLDIHECSVRALTALERLGTSTPYIARAEFTEGSASQPDAELDRIIKAACRSVSPDAVIVDGVNPFPNGLGALRKVGMGAYGFHPLELPDGLDDASRRAFGCDERIPKFALGRMVRVIFETCVRFCS